MTNATMKSTINLNKYYKEQLEYFVKIKALDSVTEGINLAIEAFVKEKQKELYAAQMKKAAADADFVKRTVGTQQAFENVDADTAKQMAGEDFEW